MKHLIVVAHPSERSLTMGLASAYAAELKRLGHKTHTLDLYRMNFNPVLAEAELSPIGPNHPVAADVLNAQKHILEADVVSVIYPLWWLSMPAILKGFVDRVFARGFAYDSDHGLIHPLLSGRKAVLVTVSGAPMPTLIQSGSWNAVQVLQDVHIFRAAGFDLLEHLHFDSVTTPLPESVALQHMTRIRTCAERNFGVA
jgi:NAD(P)H dehydrogenase (quinone)